MQCHQHDHPGDDTHQDRASQVVATSPPGPIRAEIDGYDQERSRRQRGEYCETCCLRHHGSHVMPPGLAVHHPAGGTRVRQMNLWRLSPPAPTAINSTTLTSSCTAAPRT